MLFNLTRGKSGHPLGQQRENHWVFLDSGWPTRHGAMETKHRALLNHTFLNDHHHVSGWCRESFSTWLTKTDSHSDSETSLLIHRGTLSSGVSISSLSKGQYLYCSHGINVTKRTLWYSLVPDAAVQKTPPLYSFHQKTASTDSPKSGWEKL